LAHLCLLVFSCCFLDTDISKGSVATHLRCGGIFSDSIITNFILIPTAKKFENWSILDEVIRRTKKCAKFLGYPVCDAWLTNRAGPSLLQGSLLRKFKISNSALLVLILV